MKIGFAGTFSNVPAAHRAQIEKDLKWYKDRKIAAVDFDIQQHGDKLTIKVTGPNPKYKHHEQYGDAYVFGVLNHLKLGLNKKVKDFDYQGDLFK